ncbi:hypothetical protein ACX9I7_01275 [Streptomyces sp. L500]
MPAITALAINHHCLVTELDLGDDPAFQARLLRRALEDRPEIIARIHRPTGCVTVIAGLNREQGLQDLSDVQAPTTLHDITRLFLDAKAPVVFTGHRHPDQLTALSGSAADLIRDTCASLEARNR